MAEELSIVLNRSENAGFGFSLLGKPGLPPIIYNILDDSPAAESGEVEVGDVILKVNETDVNRFSTKEVLKCLRLSSDPVTLKIKRDPKIKATVRKHLLSISGNNTENSSKIAGNGGYINSIRPEPAIHQSCGRSSSLTITTIATTTTITTTTTTTTTNGSSYLPEQEPLLPKHDKSQPKFEAFMMTGEHILNISRMPQTTNIIPKKQKKVDNLRYHNSHTHHLRHQHNSVPNSPNEMDLGLRNCSNSATTSPISANKRDLINSTITTTSSSSSSSPSSSSSSTTAAPTTLTTTTTTTTSSSSSSSSSSSIDPTRSYNNTNNFVRTSRSEDHLQIGKNDYIGTSSVNVDVDDDLTSSLNTLLDTRPDSVGSNYVSGDSDRIVWTYNAPMTDQHKVFCHTLSNGSSSSHSNTSPTSSSPLHSVSPASPTSVSSSVMSSQSGSRRIPFNLNGLYYQQGQQLSQHSQQNQQHQQHNGDYSVSEAISNISTPDYHDEDSMDIRDCVMEISDPSDSDSTLLVSEPRQQQKLHRNSNSSCGDGGVSGGGGGDCSDHRIVIQVKGPDKDNIKNKGKSSYCDNNGKSSQQATSDLIDQYYGNDDIRKSPSPHSSEDESDVESLHSFHYSPKAVDLPSAIRLAKRLYSLDGFKKSDVSRHLSKNNDFSRAVAEEYLKYFDFENDTLDTALRKFLKQFSLTGETQERERVLVHFSKRFLDCNPGSFNSQDAVHTLTCAIMLLNTDLHGQNISRKMTCNEFIENLAGLNECENFPKEVLKHLYNAIKNYPLEWALDEENEDGTLQAQIKNNEQLNLTGNPFLEIQFSSNAIEYKKGYVMRKCCYEANAKRSLCCIFLAPFLKRNWKMFYCTLRDLVLYLHKDENGFRKSQVSDNVHNAIRIHHALATKANDYTKKQYVFRLQTADQAEYLFQTSDSKELQSWIDTINFVCASFSAPPLEAAVGSQKKFQRPLLPCSHTKLNLREQLHDHEERVMRLEDELVEHQKAPPERGSKSLVIQNYKEKEAYLNYELKRYKTYLFILKSRISQYPELGVNLVENSIGEVDEATGVTFMDGNIAGSIIPPPIPDRPSPSTNRRCPD